MVNVIPVLHNLEVLLHSLLDAINVLPQEPLPVLDVLLDIISQPLQPPVLLVVSDVPLVPPMDVPNVPHTII